MFTSPVAGCSREGAALADQHPAPRKALCQGIRIVGRKGTCELVGLLLKPQDVTALQGKWVCAHTCVRSHTHASLCCMCQFSSNVHIVFQPCKAKERT